MPGPTTLHTSGSPSLGGSGGRPSSLGPGKRILPHIDDITSVTVNIDNHTPVEKVLAVAESTLRQAESYRTFGRPDLALADYLRASSIILDIIRHNKGWVSLRRDNKSLSERYNRLLRRVQEMHPDFEAVKEHIKADNARTGVQPTVSRPSSTDAGPRHPPTATPVAKVSEAGENGVKSKPAVHPKPANLQGKSLLSNAAASDLMARFTRLRTSTSSSPSASPLPDLLSDASPNPSPASSLAPPTAGLNGVAPAEMPRMPAAIYNPPRGSISSETAALPSSTPRSMFSRTSSTASLSGGRQTPPVAPNEPALAPAPPIWPAVASAKRQKPPVPEGDTISVDDLIRLMKVGARDFSILLMDIRSRAEFDDGHIMSQATICLEPEVLLRPNISADELAEAMVLAPSAEQVLFEKRHAFDLVVFYDQRSSHVPDKPQDTEARAVRGLFDALREYDFPGPGAQRCQPKLLRGGLDAWTDAVGLSSLQSSSTSPKAQHAAPPIAQALLRTPRQKYVTRPIQDPAEAQRWEESIADVKAIEPIRSKDDFLRRFPAISSQRESMTSPATSPPRTQPQSPFHHRMLSEEHLYTSLPAPPAPPPPAVPRRTYSGLAESDDSAVVLAKRAGAQYGGEPARRYRTGLQNPGVWCFANSSLQAMFATPGFSREVWSGAWKEAYKVPVKPDENIENPQLLTKCLANLFHWLNLGTIESIIAKTFMDYTRYIHGKAAEGRPNRSENDLFGGPNQQDAQEFYSFIMDVIHDETNVRRNRKPPKEKEYTPKTGTIVQNAMDYWRSYSQASASIVDKYFRGLEAFVSRCQNPACQQVTHLFQPCDVWILNLANMGDDIDFYRLLENHQKEELFPDLICETCKQRGRTRMAKFARLPDRLVFCFNRFHNSAGGGIAGGMFGAGRFSSKIHAKVRFPIRDLDLARFFAADPAGAQGPGSPSSAPPHPSLASHAINHPAHAAPPPQPPQPPPPRPPKEPLAPAADPSSVPSHHVTPPFIYDCYAVTVHAGQGINGGHYIAYVQDDTSPDPADWFRCNDSVVSRVRVTGGGGGGGGGVGASDARGDVTEEMYGKGGAVAYMVFYRRRGT
ncbi:hypothetical protein VTJ83DRAFT_7162 [Remersonia thermophila]|uniref:Ubiquitin carboxyl-terminal hydrolase n=1 Tax=Remersonia thermophila TaxID=72144 RepID=A0ABR4D2Q8_9PEZI